MFVLDVAGGGDVARKGGPGIDRADLLVVNKTDLAPYVGVDVPGWSPTPSTPGPAVRCWRCHGPTPTRSPPWSAWVVERLDQFRGGRLVPVDPGPMAAHAHAHEHATRTEVRSSHLRAFCLSAYGGTRVALVPEQAVLLAGDHVEVTVRVARGAALEIVEPGGTVAYAMRGRTARWDVSVEVEEGGSLIWHGEPFVVAEGADVMRCATVDAGDGRQGRHQGDARPGPIRRETGPVGGPDRRAPRRNTGARRGAGRRSRTRPAQSPRPGTPPRRRVPVRRMHHDAGIR